jgi:O-glycosyl hydrolase
VREFLDHLIHPGRRVRIDPATRYQTVEGWGTSLAWWGHVVGSWPDETRNAIADLVFSPSAGLGLNVAR